LSDLTRQEQVEIGDSNYAQFVMPLADMAGRQVASCAFYAPSRPRTGAWPRCACKWF
jgi:hypothetical protein